MRPLFLCLLLVLNADAFAAIDEDDQLLDNRFQVEVVIFERPSALTSAVDDESSLLPSLHRSIILENTSNDATVFPDYQLLPKRLLTLTKDASRLQNKGHYTLLAHYAWYQTEGESQPVHLFNQAPSDAFSPYQVPDYERHQSYRVDGLLEINKKNYFLLRSQFVFNVTSDKRTLRLNLNQTRRLKANELHYIDNPQFGLLVKISPFVKPS